VLVINFIGKELHNERNDNMEIKNLRGRREKHYENGDGTITAYMYDEDVHYMCDGVYRQIDNTLEDKGEYYENKYNEFKAMFSKESDDLVCVNSHNHYLKMYLLDKNNMILEKNKENIIYKNIIDDVDIDYKVISNKLKESIILNNKNNYPTSFNFFIDTDLELEYSNKKINANCKGETVFIIDTPYMIDSKKEINDNIEYVLTKVDGGYNLKLELDEEWLNSDKREYPVVIDPTIINGTGENVYDTWISEGIPDKPHNDSFCWVGYFPIVEICRGLLKFPLPEIEKGFEIINAEVNMNYEGASNAETIEERSICVHKVTSSWDEKTVCWNDIHNKYLERIEDVFTPKITENDGNCTFNLTSLVKEWYSGEANNGIMLKWFDESKNGNSRIFRFFSKDYDAINGTTKRPYLTITYVNHNGIKNYMSYTSLQHTNGISQINNFNGNLNSNFYVNKTIGTNLPLYLSVNYNSHDVLINSNSTMLGWKFNYEEELIENQLDNRQYLKYIDSTNAIYYFYKENNIYKDEEGLNLQIILSNNTYEMTDKVGNKKIFTLINNRYLLSKIIDVSKNEINIKYLDGKISNITNKYNDEIKIRYEGNSVVTESGYETTRISLTNNQVSSIETKVGKTTFRYNNKLISSIEDINGSQVSFEYNKDNKVVNAKKYGFNNKLENSFDFVYGNNITSVTDKNNKKLVYTFNDNGCIINQSLHNNSNNLSETYVNVSEYEDNNINKNKLISTNSYRKYINNLLINSGFEEDYTKCNFVIDGERIEKIGYQPYISLYDGKRYFMMENNDTITFDIEDEDDYTLSFDLTYKVHYRTYSNLLLFMEREGEKEYVDGFSIELENDRSFYENRTLSLTGHFLAGSKMILEHHRTEGSNYAYLSDLQLEKGLVANSRNILSNSDFSNGTESWNLSNSNYEIVTLNNQEKALRINANPDNKSEVIKKFRINEEKGKTYEVSFWYKNEGIAKNGSIVKIFINDEDITKDKTLSLNSNNIEWQYFSYSFKTDIDFANITLKIITKDVNYLYLTNFMAIKDPRSLLFDYDEKGNLTSSKNLSNDTKTFKYDKNNQLLSTFTPKGSNYKYEYDNVITDRILKGISPTGISNEIKYDKYGNPIKTIINNVNIDGKLVENRSYLIRLKGTEKYLSCNFKTNLINLSEDNCNPQAFKLIKVDNDYYKLQIGYKYLTIFGSKIILSTFNTEQTLFKINTNDNGSYTLIPKIDESKILGNINDLLSIVDKSTSNNEFYFEDLETPLFIESKSYYTSDGKFVTCVEDTLGNKTRYDVDKTTGLNTSIINPKGHKTLFNYNEKEQVVGVLNDNKTITYTYDEHDLLSKIKSGSKEYSFTYNDLGQRLKTNINDSILISNEYDENNNDLIKSTYGNGYEVNYTYDEFDRIKEINTTDNNYKYYYDDFGSISKISTDNIVTHKYVYDLARRLERFISGNLNIQYLYDENSNVISKTYDIFKRENIITRNVSCEYNQDDNITKLEVDGNTVKYNYDYLGRLVNKNINDNLQLSYTYITKGDRTSLIVNTYTIGKDTYEYEYDEVYNITKIYLNDKLVNEYNYDKINQLISESDHLLKRKYQYVYDIEGNIVAKKEYDLNTDELLHTNNYEYNNSKWEDQLTKFNDEVITYDAIGNPLTIGNASLTWKGRRLATYTKGDLDVSYDYNIDGIRTSKIVNGEAINYILEGKNIIIEDSPKGMIYYIYDSNEVVGLKYNNQTYFYKKNLQGDIIGLYNSNFEQIVTYTYDSWGKVLSVTDNFGNEITDNNHIGLINPFRYRSYYYDEETKLYYLNSRYYNSEWGRFISVDNYIIINPYEFGNLFVYCSNNFINYLDTHGNKRKSIKDAIFGFLFGSVAKVNVNTTAKSNEKNLFFFPVIKATNTNGATTTTTYGHTDTRYFDVVCDINTNPDEWLNSGCGVETNSKTNSGKLLLTLLGQNSSFTHYSEFGSQTYGIYHDLSNLIFSFESAYIDENNTKEFNQQTLYFNIGIMLGAYAYKDDIISVIIGIFEGELVPSY